MQYDRLNTLAKSQQWSDLEQEWLSFVEQPDADAARLLPVLETVVKAGKDELAATIGWAWLSSIKETRSAREALQLGRALLLALPDGDALREEILSLYKQTHNDRPDLEAWVERSGLQTGKSVRRALRYLDTGLRLEEGTYVIHRTEDEAGEIVEFDFEDDIIAIKSARRRRTFEIAKLIEDYDIADENDFRVLSQLRPERLAELIEKEPITVAIGVLRSNNNQIDRDNLKLLLVPAHLPQPKWNDWWGKIRNGVKRSRNLRLEGRSPMFLIYDEVGQSVEKEVWDAFQKATSPRECLAQIEVYFRDKKQQKEAPDTAFLDRVQGALIERINRFMRHKEPENAFATAIIIEQIGALGVDVSPDAQGMAVKMLQQTSDPVATVAAASDAKFWPLAVQCIARAFPEKKPEYFSELILYAPASQCDNLAKDVVKAGRGALLPAVILRATADPGRFTDAMMWIWKGPSVKIELPIPPLLETLNILLGLVGPARVSEGKAAGQTDGEMRARVRSGLAARDYATYRECIKDLDLPMAQTIRRLIQRAEGLGPSVQEDMGNILRARFPKLYVEPKVKIWENESVRFFTKEGLKRREDEVFELVNVKMKENAKAIGEAAERGDLSENAEYKFALEERDLLRARLAKLNSDLSLATLLEPDKVRNDYISIGNSATLVSTSGGESRKITILGVGDSDINNAVYSYQTPIAQSLLGSRPNEVIRASFDGQEAEYRVTQIDNAIKVPEED